MIYTCKVNLSLLSSGQLKPTVEQVEGIEKQFFVNHLANFHLVDRLLDSLTPDARVVVVSSQMHRDGQPCFPPDLETCTALEAYKTSKLANVLFAYRLQRTCHIRNFC